MTATASAAAPKGWLFGPATDLVLGCGLGSMAIMVLQASVGGRLAHWAPGALLILIFALPHYGATLLRTYDDPKDRRKYRLFAGVAGTVVGCALVGSLYAPLFGSLVLTLYLTWSPWHYTGQNYGITLMLLARRGVRVSPAAKRLLHASFVLSFAMTFLAIHGEKPQATYAPVSYGGTIFELLPLGIPQALVGHSIVVVGGAYVAIFIAAVWQIGRVGGIRRVAPSVALMLTQALWFSVPVAIRYFDLAGESLFRGVYTAYGFLWIAAYHSMQYLWITTYFATESGGVVADRPLVARRAVFLFKAMLLGYAVWTLPALVLAPGMLGRLPHESGLSLMVAATVNLHHFLLDGAIWKLRDGRVARILLDTSPPPPEGAPLGASSGSGSWTRRVVYGLGALCLGYAALSYVVDDFGFSKAMRRGDLVAARTAMERLAWLGRDGPGRHTEFGRRLAREGRTQAARREFERSIALQPTTRGAQSLARLYEEQGEWHAAATAYDTALALAPNDASMLFRQGRAWLKAGEPERAVPPLERAQELAPDEKIIGLNLTRARREAQNGSSQ